MVWDTESGFPELARVPPLCPRGEAPCPRHGTQVVVRRPQRHPGATHRTTVKRVWSGEGRPQRGGWLGMVGEGVRGAESGTTQ